MVWTESPTFLWYVSLTSPIWSEYTVFIVVKKMAMILRWESTIVSQKVRIKLCTRQARYIFVDVCMCSCMWISVQCIELKFAESLSPYRIAQINPSRTSGKSNVDHQWSTLAAWNVLKREIPRKSWSFFSHVARDWRIVFCLPSNVRSRSQFFC